MKRIVTGIGALLASAAPVLAGGIERAPQSLAPLFEQGNYAELSFGGVNPDVQGTDAAGFASRKVVSRLMTGSGSAEGTSVEGPAGRRTFAASIASRTFLDSRDGF